MLARIHTSLLHGIEAHPIEVEVTFRSSDKSTLTIIGLADNSVREARDRVLSAIRHSGYRVPQGTLLVNLAPAEIRKEGASLDLAIALGVLASTKLIPLRDLDRLSVHGELALDGQIRPIRGTVAMAICAKEQHLSYLVVPPTNIDEVSLVPEMPFIAPASLADLTQTICKREFALNTITPDAPTLPGTSGPCISEVWGQQRAKRALTIAAAGGHNLLMVGPPGCGKSMLAERFPSLLPTLTEKQRLTATKIHSLAGLPLEGILAGMPPFRAPHHVTSEVGLIGGGSTPRPGEISLAHHGVLFLDEFPEYRRAAIEALRAPLENGKVLITRARCSMEFPARFQLIGAMNPCPCGRLGSDGQRCDCSAIGIQKYMQKLSQPILDRIDLHVELEPVPLSVLTSNFAHARAEADDLRAMVRRARVTQIERSGKLNSTLGTEELKQQIDLDTRSKTLLERSSQQLGFTARSFVRILRTAQTIADIQGDKHVTSTHIAEAISLRKLERLQKHVQAA